MPGAWYVELTIGVGAQRDRVRFDSSCDDDGSRSPRSWRRLRSLR